MTTTGELAETLKRRAFVWHGRQPCCGATNAPCPRPPGVVLDYGTGCEECGHPKSCHIWRT